MCIVMVCDRELPSKETLISAEKMNGDGGGIAWIDRQRNKVRWKKGLKAEEIRKYIKKHDIPLPIIIHMRIATEGGVCKELCHPFPITKSASLELEGEADAVLFHNGHWTSWKELLMQAVIQAGLKVPSGKWSDSRAMALLASIYGINFLQFVGGKVAVMTPKSIRKFGEWVKVGNVSCSNDYFRNDYRWKGNNYYSEEDFYSGNNITVYTEKDIKEGKTKEPVEQKKMDMDDYIELYKAESRRGQKGMKDISELVNEKPAGIA